MDGKPNCENCRFWEEESKTSDVGECRRHAPRPAPRTEGMELFFDVSFPLTSMVHWCGEHEPVA